MKTYFIPALITLSAGALYCLLAIRNHLSLLETLTQLLIVLLIFYVAGTIVKIVLDRNFPPEEEPEETEGEETEAGEEGAGGEEGSGDEEAAAAAAAEQLAAEE